MTLRTPRVYPTSLLEEAFQPLPLTPECGPVYRVYVEDKRAPAVEGKRKPA